MITHSAYWNGPGAWCRAGVRLLCDIRRRRSIRPIAAEPISATGRADRVGQQTSQPIRTAACHQHASVGCPRLGWHPGLSKGRRGLAGTQRAVRLVLGLATAEPGSPYRPKRSQRWVGCVSSPSWPRRRPRRRCSPRAKGVEAPPLWRVMVRQPNLSKPPKYLHVGKKTLVH
jgi:hypothetical protein